MIEKIVPGQIVISKAGRDKFRHLVVVEVLDENFVMIADGKTRLIDNPKKKKIKHLSFMNENALKDDKFTFTNKNLKRILQRYNEGDKY